MLQLSLPVFAHAVHTMPRFSSLAVCIATIVTLVAMNVGLTIYTYATLHQVLSFDPLARSYTYVGDDYPAQLPITQPPVGHVLVSGAPNFSIYDDDEWGTLFPTDGFTEQGPERRIFQLSMFHQLHCLDVMRVAFVIQGPGAEEHFQHCIRYLLQTVLCAADVTLEPDQIQNRSIGWGASGVGQVHRCRDWKAVLRYISEHPIVDSEA